MRPDISMPAPTSVDNVVHSPRHERPYLDAYNRTSRWCWWTVDDRPGEQFDVGYAVGDLRWVRETVSAVEDHDGIASVRYAADQT